ncbi:uncharacterized protein METZ01_LOCUS468581 [marine metagenome]|uniref:Uncharacterized protein n=1 Tax=marine metagenome TaxID=408172 RepID=A0A383B6G9_9ZZZZ
MQCLAPRGAEFCSAGRRRTLFANRSTFSKGPVFNNDVTQLFHHLIKKF